MDDVYNPSMLKGMVKVAAREIRKLKRRLKFTHLAFRGSSGAAIAYPLSAATGIKLIHVRKSKEKSHGIAIEGSGQCEKYLIVDDFVSEGTTAREIIKAIGGKAECVGIALYVDGCHNDVFISKGVTIPVFDIS